MEGMKKVGKVQEGANQQPLQKVSRKTWLSPTKGRYEESPKEN